MKYGKRSVVGSFLPVFEGGRALVREEIFGAAGGGDSLVARLRLGLEMKEFHRLQALLSIPEEELGRLVGISAATLHRRKKAGVLETPESERIVRFARLFGLAVDIFGSEDAAREWLKAENPGTDSESPLSYADTEFGAREVENLLGRLDHGVFA